MPYIGVSPQFGVRRKHTYTATAGQTSFSGAGSEGATLSYTDSNFVDVYQNGVKLGDADYTSTSGTAIVLAQGASVDDLVEIIVFDAFSISDTVSKSDGGTFDGNVTMAGTLGVTGTQTNNGNLVVSKAIPNVDIKDTGTAQSSMDFLSNSDTVRATIGMERSAGGGLFVGSSAYAAVFGTASSGNTEFATNNNIQMKIDSTGAVTMPNQPAFLVTPANNQNNLANHTVFIMDNEIFDQNSDFDTSNYTFTAPVTGRYQLQFVGRFNDIDQAGNWVRVELVTSNRYYQGTLIDPGVFASDPQYWSTFNFAVLADMDAGDTAFLQWGQSGGAAQADLDTDAQFSGYLVC